MGTPDSSLFRTDVWVQALQRYTATTHLTVMLFGNDGEQLSEPSSLTPVFEFLNGSGHARGLLAACAARVLTQSAGAPPVVEEEHGLAVVGTPLILAEKTIGSAVAGYLVTRFADQLAVQRLALKNNVPVGELWTLLRQQLPLAHERIMVYGELLQTLCGALLTEIYEAQRLRRDLAHVGRVSTIGQLTASLAHELNQPLTAILSNAQAAQRLLRAEPVKLEEIREILTEIVEDDKRAAEVIDRLRGLLKNGGLNFTVLDVNELVGEVARLVSGDAILCNVAVQLELAPHLPLVRGDRVQLQQVVMNLVLNALDAIRESGGTKRTLVLWTGKEDAVAVLVGVRDSGTGIDEDGLDHIFEAFYTTRIDGLGMGLAIARSIVEAHGGRLEARNNPDRGATLAFTLPAADEGSS